MTDNNTSLCEKIYHLIEEESIECESPSCQCLVCFIKENMCCDCEAVIGRMVCECCDSKLCEECMIYEINILCKSCSK